MRCASDIRKFNVASQRMGQISDGQTSEEFGIERELNPFIESDKKLEDMNLSALQLTCHVSRIVYSDGSTLELKTSLN